MLVPHDAVYEGLKKLPREGRWNNRWGTVHMCCPVCKGYFHLGRHSIDSDGHVSPSVVCVNTKEDRTPCPFHEYVTLQGWAQRLAQLPF